MIMMRVVTVGEALAAFRHDHGLSANESAQTSWTCHAGPIVLRLPNFGWRKRAILAHDLHHVLTEIPCTMQGEFQMAAWEFGAGPMPHWGAHMFCVPLVLIGLFWSPCSIWLAFLAGRRSQTLHGSNALDALLDAPLESARRAFNAPIPARASIADGRRFAIFLLQAAALLLGPIAGVLGVWIVLATA